MKVTAEEIAAVISKMTNFLQLKPKRKSKVQQRREAEAVFRKDVERIISQPHKCRTSNCCNLIPSSEEYCDACKQITTSLLKDMNLRGGTTGCQICGRSTVPNEDYCQEHLGD
ncbi:MAG TPA: hypothetical protein VE344_00190 [Methylomirabilota bacterium]|nr:hypothetical protein [Methylomirabilota bacterium]